MARVLHKPAVEIVEERLEECKMQHNQCCEHGKATERVLESLALPLSKRIPPLTKDKALHQVPGYIDPAAVFAASSTVSWRYEALYRTLMEPILQVLHATYPSLHWPFLVHQHIRQLPMYDIPEDDVALVISTASLAFQEVEQLKDDIMDEELFDQDGEPPCGGFDLGDDDDDDEGSNSSGDEHASTTVVKKRDYLQYLRVIDLAYFPTRFGGHHRHYFLHGPYQRVMLGFHSRFHSTNPTNAKIHRDYGLLYCIWDRSPKAVAFQHSLQKVYTPQSGVLDMIQRLLLARYPSKIQALRLPISRLKASDLDPALFSAQAHRATQPLPMPSRSAFIARRMTHLSRIEIHGLSHLAEDWQKLQNGLAYLSAVNDPTNTIRELSIRSTPGKICGYWMRRVLATLPKLEVLEVHGAAENTCLIHARGDREVTSRVWIPQPTDQGREGARAGLNNGHNETYVSSPGRRGLCPSVETPSNSQGSWTEVTQSTNVAACECHWLSTWPVEHCQALRVLDLETGDCMAMQWRQYSDLARFPNLEELRLVGRDQDMFEWVLDARERLRKQQDDARLAGQVKQKASPNATVAVATHQQQQQSPRGTLEHLKKLSLVLHAAPVAGVLIDRCNAIFGHQLQELVLVQSCWIMLKQSWRFTHVFATLRRLAIRDYTFDTFDIACLGQETCPQLEVLVLRYAVRRSADRSTHLLGTAVDIEETDRHVEQEMVPALKGLTRLRSLWLEGTWFMSMKAVSAIVSELSQLHMLGLHTCPNIKASSTELKKMVAELCGHGGEGGKQKSTNLSAVTTDKQSNGVKGAHRKRDRSLELRWMNTDLPETHTWRWQDTKILYDH
ncbi:hypothetical protein BGZ73_006398 [Actinomortierella ambigua]|nr:hypothetical protein BGZ73_006398 [Actinomortierella ambigua]